MENLLVNLGRATPQKMGGRDYLVAPLTLIVPGVLSGSQGPIYYPPDEVERWPGLWNHVPLVVYHPVQDGQHVSARDPAVLDKSGVGLVLRDTYAENRRSAEAWFEVEATKRVDRTLAPAYRVLPRLLSGKPIEISTGLDLDKEPAPEGATHNGQVYSSIARNFRPDHLAILPDAKGACSNNDGCGVNVNEEVDNAWSEAAREAALEARLVKADKGVEEAKKGVEVAKQDLDQHDQATEAALVKVESWHQEQLGAVQTKLQEKMAEIKKQSEERKVAATKKHSEKMAKLFGVSVNEEIKLFSIDEEFEVHLAINCGGKGGTKGPCAKGKESKGTPAKKSASKKPVAKKALVLKKVAKSEASKASPKKFTTVKSLPKATQKDLKDRIKELDAARLKRASIFDFNSAFTSFLGVANMNRSQMI